MKKLIFILLLLPLFVNAQNSLFTVPGQLKIKKVPNTSAAGDSAAIIDVAGNVKKGFPVASAVLSVGGTANRITSTGGIHPVIDISASYVGQGSITTLGTIVSGVWHGTVIDPAYLGYTFNNGLTNTSGVVQLGGVLTRNTLINTDNFEMRFTSGIFIGDSTNFNNENYIANREIVSDTLLNTHTKLKSFYGVSEIGEGSVYIGVNYTPYNKTTTRAIYIPFQYTYPVYTSDAAAHISPIMVLDTCIGCTFNPSLHSLITSITGSYSLSATAQSTFTISIGSTMPNNTYKVNFTPTSSTATSTPNYVTNKTTTSFDVVFTSAVTGVVSGDWEVFK